MRNAMVTGFLLMIGAAGIDISAAAPPPPPPPGAVDRASAILHMPQHGDLSGYVSQFADDVTLSEKRQIVARGRAGVLRYFQEHQGLTITVLDTSYGNPIMASETVSNMPEAAVPGVVYDCCYWARVATYHLNDVDKVDQVEFIENAAPWEQSDRSR